MPKFDENQTIINFFIIITNIIRNLIVTITDFVINLKISTAHRCYWRNVYGQFGCQFTVQLYRNYIHYQHFIVNLSNGATLNFSYNLCFPTVIFVVYVPTCLSFRTHFTLFWQN